MGPGGPTGLQNRVVPPRGGRKVRLLPFSANFQGFRTLRVVRTHLADFLATVAARTKGGGPPSFVVAEFRTFLRCGLLAHGFARVRCGGYAFERLVPFSCEGRGFCASCGGRRMAERPPHLVEHVLPPDVPVRQWVLPVPHRLRPRPSQESRPDTRGRRRRTEHEVRLPTDTAARDACPSPCRARRRGDARRHRRWPCAPLN